jgi:alpha-N-arabinofuranosidase
MIGMEKDHYYFYYRQNQKAWTILHSGLDAKFLSTKTAGGFVGAVFALYCTSGGESTSNKALFNWFDYKGNDEVFK